MDYLLQKPQSNLSSLIGDAERGSYQTKQSARKKERSKDRKERRPTTPGRRRVSVSTASDATVASSAEKDSRLQQSRRLDALQQIGEEENMDDQPISDEKEPDPTQARRPRGTARRQRGAGRGARSSVAGGSVMGGTSAAGSVIGGGKDDEAFDAEKHAGDWQREDVEALRAVRKLNAEAAATTQQIVNSLDAFDHKLTDLEQLMKPIQDETVELKNAHTNITVSTHFSSPRTGTRAHPPSASLLCPWGSLSGMRSVSWSSWTLSWLISIRRQRRRPSFVGRAYTLTTTTFSCSR